MFAVTYWEHAAVFGSLITHHCLVVDLDHLVACVDLLTLVCGRL